GDGHRLELPRRDVARAPGSVGGFAGRLSPDAALQMVELARQLRSRKGGRSAMGQGVGRWRGGVPKQGSRRAAMSAISIGGGSQAPGIARVAADWLGLAAAPAFAAMALMTGAFAGG